MSKSPRKATLRSSFDEFRKEKRAKPSKRREAKQAKAQTELGERLRKLRENRGMYLHEVVRLLNPRVWPQTLHKWESGQIQPSIARLTELAQIYETTVSELVGNAGPGA